jgi:hypothetical protein
MIKIIAEKTKLKCINDEFLTSGAVNVNQIEFEFNNDWAGLSRTVIFVAGDTKKIVLLDDTNICDMPWEILAQPGPLSIGIYGTRDDTIVLPTEYVQIGHIHRGADPDGDPILPPIPTVYQQLLTDVSEIAENISLDFTVDGDRVGIKKNSDTEYVYTQKLTGKDGQDGADGKDGNDGSDGAAGKDGDSAYEIAVENGFVGTKEEWIASLKGKDGDDGYTPIKGIDYFDGRDGGPGPRGYSGLLPAVTAPYASTLEAMANTVTTLTLSGDTAVTLGDPVEGYDNEWDIIIPMPSPVVTLILPVVTWGLGAAPIFDAGSTTMIRLYYLGAILCGEWMSV